MNKPASGRQLEYIRQLQTEYGLEDQPQTASEGMTGFEASKIIADLISRKTPVYSAAEGFPQPGGIRINQARLGLAMKECFRLWTGQGRDIWTDKRQPFIEATIKTYALFSEIAERIRAGKYSAPGGD